MRPAHEVFVSGVKDITVRLFALLLLLGGCDGNTVLFRSLCRITGHKPLRRRQNRPGHRSLSAAANPPDGDIY